MHSVRSKSGNPFNVLHFDTASRMETSDDDVTSVYSDTASSVVSGVKRLDVFVLS